MSHPVVPRLASLVLAGLVLELALLLLWPLGAPVRTPTVDPAATLPPLSVAVSLSLVLGLAGLAYLAGLLLMDRGLAELAGAGWLVVAFTLLFQLTLLLMPGTFSRDPFSYFAYGQVAGVAGLNPYLVPPDTAIGSASLRWVDPDWRALTSPYGPLWTSVSALLASIMGDWPVERMLVVNKLLMAVIQLANLGLIWWLVRRTLVGRGARLTALAVFAWNPLVLLELIGNGHNDALMVLLLLASLVPLAGQARTATPTRWLLAAALLCLSAMVKYATILVAPVMATVWARELRTWRTRAGWLAVAGLVMLLVAGLAYQPWFTSLAILRPALGEINGDFHAHSLAGVLRRGASELPFGTWTQPLVNAVIGIGFGVYVLWELHRLWLRPADRSPLEDVARTSARVLMVLLLVASAQLQAWYFVWPLALVTVLGWRQTLTQTVVAFSLAYLPVAYLEGFDWNAALPTSVRLVLGVVALGLPLAVPLVRAYPAALPSLRRRASGRLQRARLKSAK